LELDFGIVVQIDADRYGLAAVIGTTYQHEGVQAWIGGGGAGGRSHKLV
jgi:hypothetical protein